MKEYGYMEGEYLRSRFVEENDIEKLDKIWKPVEKINDSKLSSSDGKVVIPVPYDAGDKIAYHYVEKEDKGGIRQQINSLKQDLSDSDYKVLKCYEASLVGDTLPYDIQSIHTERQSIRDKINELEGKLS